MLLTIFHLITTCILTAALPSPARNKPAQLTAQNILSIAPDAATCASAPFPSECRTATQAAPLVSLSYAHYNITSFGAQAALLALMLYESGSFKYSQNHWPGVPGQGTRNMQSPAYNLKYATWLATNAPTEARISMTDVDAASAAGPAAVLALVNGDVPGFGSAAWFLKTQCDASVEEGLAGESAEAWDAYLTSCVGTTVTDDRTAIWEKAIQLGKW